MNGNNKNYSIRPLTDEEREFASDLKNYNYLFFYMKKWRLDQDTWYDILIEPYLNAVKKYHEYESARQYAFSTVLKNMLYSAVTRQLKMERAKKRIPKDKLYSLDYTLQGDNPFAEYTSKSIEEFLVNRNANPEKQYISKETYAEFLEYINEYVGREAMQIVIRMLLEGYSRREIIKQVRKELGQPDWANEVAEWNFTMRQLGFAFERIYGYMGEQEIQGRDSLESFS